MTTPDPPNRPVWATDRKLLTMVKNNHQPTEWLQETDRNQPDRLARVVCGYCYNDWPCITKRKIDEEEPNLPPEPTPAKSTPQEGQPDPNNPGVIRTRTSFQG